MQKLFATSLLCAVFLSCGSASVGTVAASPGSPGTPATPTPSPPPSSTEPAPAPGVDGGTDGGTETLPPPPAASNGDDGGTFTIVTMPDVQHDMWDAAGVERWHNRLQWIIDHRASLNIKMVLQVGDLTDTDSCGGADVVSGKCTQALRDFGTYWPIAGQPTHYHFTNADSGLKMLDAAGIPYAMAPGNHDTAIVCGGPNCYQYPQLGVPSSSQVNLLRITNAWNKWFPPSRFKDGIATFESGKSDNMAHEFFGGGAQWLAINLELYARPAVVTWAKGLIAAHPHHNVILFTHSYLMPGNAVGTSKEYGDTAPTYVRDELVKTFPNVKFTFSGHVGRAGYRAEPGVSGNTVHSFLDCYHDTTNNLLRVVTIDAKKNTASTYVYSPRNGYYEPNTTATLPITLVH